MASSTSLSISQQRTLAVLPKVSAGLSIIFSSIIAWMVIRDPKKRQSIYHRLILGISVSDMFSSFFFFLSTWPIPRETGILWAVGNTQTCTAQGFFIQASIANPLYNASLSFYFLMAVQRGRGSRSTAMLKRLEPLFHLLPFLWAYGTAIAGLPLQIFNSADLWCWIGDYPGRNENTNIYRWSFFYGPLWLGILTVTCNLIRLFFYVGGVARESEKNSFGPSYPIPLVEDEQPDDNKVDDDDDESSDDDGILSWDDEGENDEEEKFDDKDAQVEIESPEDRVVRMQTASTGSEQLSPPESSSLQLRKKTSKKLLNHRNKLAWQCLRYAVSFYCTWTPITILRIFQAMGIDTPFPLKVLSAFAVPFQGLPNFLAYLYPRLVEGMGRWHIQHYCFDCNNHNHHANTPLETPTRSNSKKRQAEGFWSPSDAFYRAYAKLRSSLHIMPSSGHNFFPSRAAASSSNNPGIFFRRSHCAGSSPADPNDGDGDKSNMLDDSSQPCNET